MTATKPGAQRFLNDPLERQKVLVFGVKQSPAYASVEHVENHPPGVCRLGRDIHGFLSRYPSLVNLVAVTFSGAKISQPCQFGGCHLFWCQDIPALSIWWLSPFLVMSPFLVNEFVGHGQELSRFRGHW